MEFVYVPALEKIIGLLERGNDVSVDEVEENLGNDISAHGSVPTAIYVFLRAQSPITGVEVSNMELLKPLDSSEQWMHFCVSCHYTYSNF